MEDDRERVFASIRRGLRSSEESTANRQARSPLKVLQQTNFDTLFKRFFSELETLGGEAVICKDARNIPELISDRIESSGSNKVIFVYEELSYLMPSLAELRIRTVDSASQVAGAALSPCIACISETGTIVIGNTSRLPAALAEQLFVVCRRENLIPSLDELFAEKYRDFRGSNLFLITGPSRTADIEKELVIGVHGPKEVFVIFID